MNLLLCSRKVYQSVSTKALSAARKRVIVSSANPLAMAIYLGDLPVCQELIAITPLPLTSVVLIIDWMYAQGQHNDIRDLVDFEKSIENIEDFDKASEGQFVFAFPPGLSRRNFTLRHFGPFGRTYYFFIPFICCDPRVPSGIPATIESLGEICDTKKATAFWEPTVHRLDKIYRQDKKNDSKCHTTSE